MHKIIKINNVLVHCADFSSRPAFRPWATSFCPSSSPPTAAIPSAESLSCRLKKTGCIKLGGRLWGRATFPLHQNLQQKKITEKRYGHTFGCIYSTNALGFGGLGYALPPLLSNSLLRRIQKMSEEGARPRRKGWQISLDFITIAPKIFYMIMNYSEMWTVFIWTVRGESYMGSISKDGGGLSEGRCFKQPFCK